VIGSVECMLTNYKSQLDMVDSLYL
jgi:hypothetical protein